MKLIELYRVEVLMTHRYRGVEKIDQKKLILPEELFEDDFFSRGTLHNL